MLGFGGNDTLNGGAGNDVLVGGTGNDTINGGAATTPILWRVGDGRDVINGGLGTDTVEIAGDASAETFRIYALAEAIAAGMTRPRWQYRDRHHPQRHEQRRHHRRTRQCRGNRHPRHGRQRHASSHGNFTASSLLPNTITFEGGDGDDTVDIPTLQSAHRIVFEAGGGNDTFIGPLRPQDIVVPQDGRRSTTFHRTRRHRHSDPAAI